MRDFHVAGCVKPAPPSPTSTDFDRGEAAAKLGAVNVNTCLVAGELDGAGRIWLTFAQDGRPIRTELEPPYAGTATGACIEEKFRNVRVRAFARGGSVRVSKAFTLRR
jgi:hypothetical protein